MEKCRKLVIVRHGNTFRAVGMERLRLGLELELICLW